MTKTTETVDPKATETKAADAAAPAAAAPAAAAPAAAAPAAAAPAAAPTLEIGKVARLKAVHGAIYHPFIQPEVMFDTDRPVKIEVDSWIKIQFEAGRLALDD